MKLFLLGYSVASATIFFSIDQQKTLKQSIEDGKMIYTDFCLQCHLADGQGVEGVFPPLADADYLFEDINRSIAGIKYGMSGPITVNDVLYDGLMTNQGLEDQEVADVMNYILNSWGNSFDEIITSERVKSVESPND
ncbi:MAG: cytochrome c [Flavobacteriaceae bacterium]|nr:cytochrome c [Flavobacteriaceae bacterium]